MRRCFLFIFSLGLITQAQAQSLTPLRLEDYLSQVRQNNPGVEGADLLQQAALDLRDEGSQSLAPQFFSKYDYIYDKRETLIPAFQGNKTTVHDLSFGVSKQMDFGLQSSVFYDVTSSTVYGVDPILYPQPHLNVQSLNLQLTQSLWKNGFGRSTKALVLSKNALNAVVGFQQQFQLKELLAEAEMQYWQLSIARAQVDVQQRSLERTQQLQKTNQRRAKLNLIDNADLLSTNAALQQRELELKNAKDQERILSRSFNQSRGQNSDVVTEPLIIPTSEVISQLPPIQKTAQRADVKAAQAQIDASKQTADIARDQYLPQLDIYTRLSTNGQDPTWADAASDTLDTDHPYAAVGVQLNVPLNFSKNSRIRKAYGKQVKGNEKNYQQTFLNQEISWNSLNQQWNETKERLDMAIELQKTQQKKLDAEKKRMQQGKSTTYQVFLNEQDLLNAELLILQTEQLAMNIYAQMKTYGE